MPGAIAIIVTLLIFPVVACMGTAVIAALLGFFLNKDAEIRHEGSELVELNT